MYKQKKKEREKRGREGRKRGREGRKGREGRYRGQRYVMRPLWFRKKDKGHPKCLTNLGKHSNTNFNYLLF